MQTLAHHGRIGSSFRHVTSSALSQLADRQHTGADQREIAQMRFSTAPTDELNRFVGLLASDVNDAIDIAQQRIAKARQQQLISIAIATVALGGFFLFLYLRLVRPTRKLADFRRKHA